MERIGFRLQVKPDLMDEYVERHQDVWEDMLSALSDTGWHNYSLFLDRVDGTLFGYFETPDLGEALRGMAATEVNSRWQSQMQKYFVDLDGKNPDEGFLRLEQVFYLA